MLQADERHLLLSVIPLPGRTGGGELVDSGLFTSEKRCFTAFLGNLMGVHYQGLIVDVFYVRQQTIN